MGKITKSGVGEGEMVRTELSNLNKLIVHFFDARQRKRCFGCAETPKKRVQGDSKSPCRSPGLCAFCRDV